MSQLLPADFPIDPVSTSGTELADILNRLEAAVNTSNAGPTPPASTYAGMEWLDTSTGGNGVLRMRDASNTAWVAVFDSSVPPVTTAGGTFTGSVVIAPAAADAYLDLKAPALKAAGLRVGGNALLPGVTSLDVSQGPDGTGYLLQRANLALVLGTNALERLRIAADGNASFKGRVATSLLQLGEDATATRNFVLRTNNDGSATLARGNAGATTQDILTVDAAGFAKLPQSYGPSFSAYASAPQAIAAGVTTRVALPNEEWDYGNCFDAAGNSRFQPNVPGLYQVQAVVRCATGSGPYAMYGEYVKNGVAIKRGDVATLVTAGACACVVAALVQFNGTTDWLELWGMCTVDGSFFQNLPATSTLQGWLVRPA